MNVVKSVRLPAFGVENVLNLMMRADKKNGLTWC